ncbi:MAG: phosphotransferase, partial [Alphaproteobacteria bacterium]|nr:phosphotransferase [Alphaproteobacteria bacterium]
MSKASLQDRSGLIEAFLERAGWAGVDRSILAADASFRSYDRLHGDNRKAVLMNAPPPQEDIRSFLRIGKILTRLGLSAPEIFASDTEAGLILLEDFGDRTYTNLLREDPSREFELYSLAVDVLIDLHRRFEGAAHVPDYDDDRLLDEAGLLFDWYLPEVGSLGLDLSDAVRSDYIELWRKIMPLARQAPKTLVLRDYHVDNLMLLEDRGGVARCGLLDFQDAVIGPSSYDLA